MANILVIDDDVQLTELLKAHLTQKGHNVTVTHRGEAGMASATQVTPDLILLDVILPDVTGFQLVSRFRKTAATETTPILMITGVARFPNQQEFGMERGANAYILKPFDMVHLGEQVDHYLNAPRTSMAPKKVVKPMSEITKTSNSELGKLRTFLKNAIHKTKFIS